jgi:hypothetical protein
MTIETKFAFTAGVMVGSMAGGYLCRRLKWVDERVGERLMTFVAVFGYPAVGFLSVWGTRLQPGDLLLPIMALAHTVLMTFLALGVARGLTSDRREQGLFAVAGGLGNNGFTMGAFVIYLLRGEQGMGVANLYFLFFILPVVLVMYPLARHFAAEKPSGSLAALMVRSLFDWRSIGLPFTLAAVWLSYAGVPRPAQISSWHLLDVLVYGITPLAFFGIGLRLHGSKVLPMWKLLTGLAFVRFGLALALGLGLAWLTHLTPWPFTGLRWEVFIIEAFVPTAVTMVAVANMFGLCPREASVLFVVNTAAYLVLILPAVLWVWR